MKKLLVGLLFLASFSVFAEASILADCKVSIKTSLETLTYETTVVDFENLQNFSVQNERIQIDFQVTPEKNISVTFRSGSLDQNGDRPIVITSSLPIQSFSGEIRVEAPINENPWEYRNLELVCQKH